MAQKRLVAPDTPITSYPTPEVADIVITVDVDSRLPGYKALEYGTLYPDQTRYPGAKLVAQTPLEDDRFVRRVFATDRVNQEAYNYAIQYSAGEPDYPIYVRTYVEPRDTYVPLADNSPDPVIPGAFLVDEEAAPADGELNNLYLKVTRIYETLPGPWVPSSRYDDDLGSVQIRRRSVVNSGQVASLTENTRTTYEARDGSTGVYIELEESWSTELDGEGNSQFPVKDRDFYDASRGPVQERRQLVSTTGNEVASLVNNNGVITQISYEAYNEFLSFEIVQTYSVNGPQLTGFATNNEGQLATVTTQRKGSDSYVAPQPTATKTVEVSREDAESVVERVVDVPEVFPQRVASTEKAVTIPDRFLVLNPTSTTSIVTEEDEIVAQLVGNAISQQVEQTGVFTAKTTTIARSLSTETLSGVDYDQTTDTTIPFTEYVSSSIPTTSCEADPIGGGKVIVKEYNVASYRAKLADISLEFPTRSSIVGVPPILKNFKVEWEFTDSSQGQIGSAEGIGDGNSGTISVSADSSSGATVSVVPKFIVEYEEVNTSNVPTTSYFFFLPYPVTLNDILAKTGSQQWPVFKPRAHVVTANGQTVRKTININRRTAVSWASESSSASVDLGNGGTTEIQNNFVTVAIQPSLCSGFSEDIDLEKEVQISVELYSSVTLPDTVTGIGGIENPVATDPRTEKVTANYTATYDIPETSPSDVPRTGIYLINSSVEPYKFGMAKVYAEVVDASIFASS
jgi:hypothetical protein